MFVHHVLLRAPVLCVEVLLHRSSLVAFMSPGMFKHAKDIKVLPLTWLLLCGEMGGGHG